MSKPELLLIDTNLLLLLLVGTVDAEQVERFKRTRAYSREDYALLADFVGERPLAATPNVLTEVSNLLGQLAEPIRTRAMLALASLIHRIDEQLLPSRHVAQEPNFTALGLADCSILLSATPAVMVLTDDFGLYGRLSARGASAINFNHVRFGAEVS
jgi:hypothetical protein